MIAIIDYTFYRIYRVYKKKDSNPILMGSLILSILVFSTSLNILTIIEVIFKKKVWIPNLAIALIILFFTWLFWRRFKNQELLLSLDEKYKAEEVRKKAWNGLFIVGYIVLALLMPVLYGVLKHNLHYDI